MTTMTTMDLSLTRGSIDLAVEMEFSATTPEAPLEEEIRGCLNFIATYKEDTAAQIDGLKPHFKAARAWKALPNFVRRRIGDKSSPSDDPSSSESIPSLEEMNKCCNAFNSAPKYVDYIEFMSLHDSFTATVKSLFNPTELWSQLLTEADKYGRIESRLMLDLYVERTILLRFQDNLYKMSLSRYGYLSLSELTHCINKLIEHSDAYADTCSGTHGNIVVPCIADLILLRLDIYSTGYVKISDLLETSIPSQLCVDDGCTDPNYLLPTTVLSLIDRFMVSKMDYEGLTCEKCIEIFPTLNASFIQRYFQVNNPGGIMYFDDFYRFHYIVDNTDDPAVLHHVFRILDVNRDGKFSIEDFEYFYPDIKAGFQDRTDSAFELDDVFDSIFDLLQVPVGQDITVKHVLNSRRAKLFCSVLMDIDEYTKFELADSSSNDNDDDDYDVEE